MNKLHILVTRPHPAGTELCHLIESQGDQAIHLPTIAFEPPTDLSKFQQSIDALGEQDWLIFISPQAVYASIAAICKAWPQLPPSVTVAAVGEGTAKALKKAGYIVATHPPAEWSSEGLLALPEFQSIQGKKVAIIRGEGGRELLEKTLLTRGAEVMHVIAYQRVIPKIKMSSYLNLLKQKTIDVMICTSYEGVQNLKKLFGDTGSLYLPSIPLIVVSQRIKILAQDLGFQTIWVASNASHQAILEVLAQKRNELCQTKKMK